MLTLHPRNDSVLFIKIVTAHQRCTHDPADRIAGHNPPQSLSRCNQSHPDDTEHTYPEHGYNGGHKSIPLRPERPGKYFNEDKHDKSGRNAVHHSHPDFHHRSVPRKNTKQITPRHHQKRRQTDSRTDRHAQTDPCAFPHPVPFAGPEVLAYKRSQCNAERRINHPENAVDLAISCPRRHCIHTQEVQGCLHDHVGNAVHRCLQAGRKSNLQHIL